MTSSLKYVKLRDLKPSKSVSFVAIVKSFSYAYNQDTHKQYQHEYRLSLVDDTSSRSVLFSLFRGPADETFKGELRPGLVVRVQRAKCREEEGRLWLYGKIGVGRFELVGFTLIGALNVFCSTYSDDAFEREDFAKLVEDWKSFRKLSVTHDDHADFRAKPLISIPAKDSDVNNKSVQAQAAGNPAATRVPLPVRPAQLPARRPIVSMSQASVIPDTQHGDAFLSQVSVKSTGSQAVPDTQTTQVVNDTQFVVPTADDSTSDFAPSPPKRRRSLQAEPQGLARNLQTLISAKPRSYFDVVCQVIAVFDYEEHVALRVWDGSVPRKGMSKSYGVLPTAIDSDLEAKAKNYFVDIVCYQEHAEAARCCQPLDMVLLINLHAYVNKTPMAAFTMHSGTRFNRGIYRLRSERLIASLQRRIAAALVEIENEKDEVDSFYEDIEESEIRLETDFGKTQLTY